MNSKRQADQPKARPSSVALHNDHSAYAHGAFTSAYKLTSHLKRLVYILLILSSAANWAKATVTFENGYTGITTELNSPSQFTYSSDVSSTDLLHGITPTTTGWNTSNNASPAELTDGVHGAGFGEVSGDNVQGAWTTVGAIATYNLGTGTNGQGYDITSLVSIADWENVGFGNQGWTLAVEAVGGGGFVDVLTVDYQPLGSNIGTTKVTATDLNITGIQSVRVTANQVNGGANAGAFVWRELDLVGEPTNDETAPTLDPMSSVSPADGATQIPLASNLEATFSESVTLTGNGSITLRNLSGGADVAISLPGEVSISGAVMTINPGGNLATDTEYAVEITTDCLQDLAGNAYAGLLATDTPNWTFTTGQADLTAPTLDTSTSVVPADGATAVQLSSTLQATFSEPVALTGVGSIILRNLSGGTDIPINLPDDVSISGEIITIDPPTKLVAQQEYAVEISSDAVIDLADPANPYAGLLPSDVPNWSFTAADEPLRIMCMGDSITVGYTDNPTWSDTPETNFKFGYRSGLYTRLSNAGYSFQFVGASTEPWTGISGDPTRGGTYTPALDLRDFNQDGHRGYGGQTASFLNSNILDWLASDDPDIILLKIGTNSQDQSGLDTLVNTITTTKPDCHLIIAQIMPKYGYQQGIVDYNTYIRETLVPNYQAMGRKVTLVDQYAPFLTNTADLTSIDQSLFSNGINHPDNVGYDKMAQVWFDGIEALGIGPTYDSWIANYPGVGEQTGIDDDPDGDRISNGIENYFGTSPNAFTQGLRAAVFDAGDGTFSFTHPHNASPANNLTATYRWSSDLQTFYNDGDPNGAGTTTVTFSKGLPSDGIITVTATVTGTEIPMSLFVDMEVVASP